MMTAITTLPQQKKRDLPAFFSTSSETLATWSFQENEPVTMSSTESHNGIIRWYDPITSRWLSKDPIGISGGLNQYVFCGGNPVNFVDPFGLVDMNYFEPGSKIHENAGKWSPNDGSFSVGIHGTPVRLEDSREGEDNRSRYSVERLANDIWDSRHKPGGYRPGQKVTLAACDTGGDAGEGRDNIAKELADLLSDLSGIDTTVSAPTTTIFWSADGPKLWASHPDTSPNTLKPGDWVDVPGAKKK